MPDPLPEASPEAAPPAPEQVAAAAEPVPPTVEPVPEPAEPAPRVFIVPEVEKSEVVVIGTSESGPAKAGWWKKRE